LAKSAKYNSKFNSQFSPIPYLLKSVSEEIVGWLVDRGEGVDKEVFIWIIEDLLRWYAKQ